MEQISAIAIFIGTITVTLLIGILLLIIRNFNKRLDEEERIHAQNLAEQERELKSKMNSSDASFHVVADRKKIKINSNDVYFVQASGNYLKIHLVENKVLYREKISNFLSLVPDPDAYLRVHRSYIVRRDKLESIAPEEVTLNRVSIPVGPKYKNAVKQLMIV
jgi:DNA-binding LytR/AlgR family response regulator